MNISACIAVICIYCHIRVLHSLHLTCCHLFNNRKELQLDKNEKGRQKINCIRFNRKKKKRKRTGTTVASSSHFSMILGVGKVRDLLKNFYSKRFVTNTMFFPLVLLQNISILKIKIKDILQ